MKINTKTSHFWALCIAAVAIFLAVVALTFGGNQTQKLRLMIKYGPHNVAYAEATYRNTVVVEKLCQRTWTEMAQSSQDFTYQQVVWLYYDMYSEIDGGRASKLPKELVNEFAEKLGPNTLRREQKFLEDVSKKDGKTLQEAYDMVCKEALMMLWDKVKKQ